VRKHILAETDMLLGYLEAIESRGNLYGATEAVHLNPGFYSSSKALLAVIIPALEN